MRNNRSNTTVPLALSKQFLQTLEQALDTIDHETLTHDQVADLRALERGLKNLLTLPVANDPDFPPERSPGGVADEAATPSEERS